MTEFEVVELAPSPAAVVRAEVPMDELGQVFDRAFGEVMAVTARQGVQITGAPFGFYPRMPGDTVEVAAGFPTSATVEADGEVEPMELPGGRVVTGVHTGPFESLAETYGGLQAWAAAEGLELGPGVWETYLTDPSAEPDPTKWQTAIFWPLR